MKALALGSNHRVFNETFSSRFEPYSFSVRFEPYSFSVRFEPHRVFIKSFNVRFKPQGV